MEVDLQSLIDKIKNDGVAAAEKSAEQKKAEAEASAEKIIADARAEAAKIRAQAEEDNKRFVKASEDAIRQASRNQLISFRDSVTKELDAVIKDSVNQSYSQDTLLALIPKVVEAWAKNPETESLEVLLNPEDLRSMETNLKAALRDKLSAGVTLKEDDQIGSGFRIAAKDGTAYYDYSAEAVANLLSKYLNPKVAELMKEVGRE